MMCHIENNITLREHRLMLCSVALRPLNAWKIYKRVYRIHSLGLWVAMYKIYCVGGKDLYTIPKQSIAVNIGGVC